MDEGRVTREPRMVPWPGIRLVFDTAQAEIEEDYSGDMERMIIGAVRDLLRAMATPDIVDDPALAERMAVTAEMLDQVLKDWWLPR